MNELFIHRKAGDIRKRFDWAGIIQEDRLCLMLLKQSFNFPINFPCGNSWLKPGLNFPMDTHQQVSHLM